MKTHTTKRYIGWPEIQGQCVEIVNQMYASNWRPDIIVGITRGGAIPAVMLSQMINVKMVGLDVSLRDSDMGPESNCWLAEDAQAGKKILIVDDINDSGATINWIVEDWDKSVAGLEHKIEWGNNVRFATIIDNESSWSKVSPQYCGDSINKSAEDIWIVFPWEEFWRKGSNGCDG